LPATSTLPVSLSGVTAFQNAFSGIAGATQDLAIVEAIVPANCDRPDMVEITPDPLASWRLTHAGRAMQNSGLDWLCESLALGDV
jgi:hypothetical protein